jgi:hypothetical protein
MAIGRGNFSVNNNHFRDGNDGKQFASAEVSLVV